MTKPEITLKEIQKDLKKKDKVFRASDFLTEEQMKEVHQSNAKGKKRGFDIVDSYIAEIIARFGYETYRAWKIGDIDEAKMMRYVLAERAREVQKQLALETIIISSMAGANHPTKSGSMSKSLKMAIEILKKEQNKAKGNF